MGNSAAQVQLHWFWFSTMTMVTITEWLCTMSISQARYILNLIFKRPRFSKGFEVNKDINSSSWDLQNSPDQNKSFIIRVSLKGVLSVNTFNFSVESDFCFLFVCLGFGVLFVWFFFYKQEKMRKKIDGKFQCKNVGFFLFLTHRRLFSYLSPS